MNTYNPIWIVIGLAAVMLAVGAGLGSEHVRAVADWGLLGGCALGALAIMQLAKRL